MRSLSMFLVLFVISILSSAGAYASCQDDKLKKSKDEIASLVKKQQRAPLDAEAFEEKLFNVVNDYEQKAPSQACLVEFTEFVVASLNNAKRETRDRRNG